MKSRYYEAELAYLREQGREFARAFPTTAGLLAERSDDPDVERLLEGFAFLASRIREKIDDGLPELAQQLCGVLVPQLTRFIPPTCVVQFTPDTRALRQALRIERGAQLGGQASTGVRCVFRTSTAVDLLPIDLVDVRHSRPTSRTDEIVLRMRCPDHTAADVGAYPIRLFLHGEVAATSALRLWMLRHCKTIEVVEEGRVIGTLRGPITACGFDPHERLLPEMPLEHDAFTHVAELFACPQKFAFVELPKLGGLARTEFDIRLRFEGAPKLPKIPARGDIRLHCTPAINLFETTSDPVRIKPLRPEALVRAAGHVPLAAEIYDVVRVHGVSAGRRVELPAFTAFKSGDAETSRYYVTRRVQSVTDAGTDLYIALVTPRDGGPLTHAEILSVDLLCSNRALGTTLSVGELNRPVRGTSSTTPFTNITPVSPPLYTHDNVELAWRLGAHVGLSRRGLQEPENLRRLLEVYNFAESRSPQLGRLNALWIDAIKDVKTRTSVRLIRGAPVTGTKTVVVLDESNFASTGEALLFGEILNEVFARRAGVNSFSMLSISLAPSRKEYGWPPRNGSLTL